MYNCAKFNFVEDATMRIEKLVSRTVFGSLSEKYVAKTGLPLILVNLNGDIVYGLNRSCKVCGYLLKQNKNVLLKNCRLKRIKAIEEAFHYGEGYITTCPGGLIIFAVPIICNKKLAGGLLSGFAIFPEMKKDFQDEISANLIGYGNSLNKSSLRRLELKVILLEEVRDYVSFLLMLTKKYSLNDIAFLKARNERYIQQYKIANFLEDLKKNNPDVERNILNKHEEIIQKVKLGDETGAREILNEFLGSIFFESGMNFEIIKVRVVELIVIISRAAIEAGAEAKELLGLNYSYLTDLNRVTDTEELLYKLGEILKNFIMKVSLINEKKKKIKVQRMTEYIKQNFKGKMRSVEVAKVAGLSQGRASHLFREETGYSLSDFNTKLRVDYGKHLLLNSDMNLADLAIEIGFFDQSHFTKTFKKIEKMPPSHFRRKYREALPSKSTGLSS